MCLCDLDIYQNGTFDQNPIIKIWAYFEVYRPLRFWYIRS